MYKVVRRFEDRDGRIYEVGDTYPAEGVKKPTSARLKVLSTEKNEYGRIYIEKK
jgi:hypothetical protein